MWLQFDGLNIIICTILSIRSELWILERVDIGQQCQGPMYKFAANETNCDFVSLPNVKHVGWMHKFVTNGTSCDYVNMSNASLPSLLDECTSSPRMGGRWRGDFCKQWWRYVGKWNDGLPTILGMEALDGGSHLAQRWSDRMDERRGSMEELYDFYSWQIWAIWNT